ncbi:MAG: carboxypeptidase-like regulatory domain-containing protein [Bacteroidetes bacterium]|nr:carboxypeptidase-like regulatory domain-containing protein [Bacteroidota bacterium]
MPRLKRLITFSFFLLFALMANWAHGQKLIQGMVVDSLTLNNLPAVNVKIKNTNRGTSTNPNGIFTILASEKDTLVFSYIGYSKAVVPVNYDDETMFVRLTEESLMLKEVVIKDQGFHIVQKYPKSPTLTTTKPLKARSTVGVGVNFAYFSKLEKEKRKLVKVMADNEKVKIYLDIVTNPDFRSDVMERYTISEERFYDILAVYNEKNREIMYSSNKGLIMNSLLSFFQNASAQKK